MVQWFKSEQSFAYPWWHTTVGIWRKYPNPHSAHVKTVDVLNRIVDPKTGDVKTERIIGVQQSAPAWAVKLFGADSTAYVLEQLHVSPSTQTTRCTSINLSLAQYLTCLERIAYTPHPADPQGKTAFSQVAEIVSVGGLGWKAAERKLEEHSVRRFGENAGRGREGFEYVLRHLKFAPQPQPAAA